MAEADILSVIQKLEKYRECKPYKNEEMEGVIKEMKEIVDIVRDEEFREGRRLGFLVSDLAHMADEALDIYEERQSSEMQSIISWIGEIKMRMLKLGVDGAETEPNSENVDEDHVVVGLDKDIEMVVRSMICHTTPSPSLIVIKGMSGIGKTTLAREIYNHPDIVKRFEYRAWVCISNVLTMKEIVIKLLDRLSSVNGEYMQSSSYFERVNNQLLQGFLGDHLEELRCLIVLDDLPKHVHLRSFLLALKAQGMQIVFINAYDGHVSYLCY